MLDNYNGGIECYNKLKEHNDRIIKKWKSFGIIKLDNIKNKEYKLKLPRFTGSDARNIIDFHASKRILQLTKNKC